mmetsp:Transcript_75547/g.125975  ORF Transcript_75547/g.125975 Transcript_75547/m.125975 type:complete len:125 (-) Transcript_75547:29-403(-)
MYGDWSARIDCDRSCPPPSQQQCPAGSFSGTGGTDVQCAAGVVASAFVVADADQDFKLDKSEASAASRFIVNKLPRRCLIKSNSCFMTSAAGDELVSRREYFRAFVPCLLIGLGQTCVSVVCSD